MNCTLASISAAYLFVFGVKHPDTMPYAQAAELVRDARADWRQVMTLAGAATAKVGDRYPTVEESAALMAGNRTLERAANSAPISAVLGFGRRG